jgi:2-polyprenyl-3-methyl-5-hydroxy-6-metoxy-1,4-benzoquinol methylase
MFLERSYHKELMDDISVNDGKLAIALNELRVINRMLGGNSVSREGINYFTANGKDKLRILDIGGGASDILYDLKKMNKSLLVYSTDLNKHACSYQKRERGNNKIFCADAFNLPLKEKSFDLIHTSLFLHHFDEEEIERLIRQFLNITKYGIIINDLRRNILAYSGIYLLTALFSKSNMVKNDGPLSVRRAFTKKDLVNILNGCGIKGYYIKRKWAFRFLVIIPLAENV